MSVIEYLNGKKIVHKFYEKELQKTNQMDTRTERVINRKIGKLHVK